MGKVNHWEIEMLSEIMGFIKKYGVEGIKEDLQDFCDTKGYPRNLFYMVLRWSVSGQGVTPPIIETLPIIGKREVLRRLKLQLIEWEGSVYN